MKYLFSLILLALTVPNVFAYTYEEAKNLYKQGKYSEALPVFQNRYKRYPKNGALNHWLGVCLYYEGDFKSAIKHLEFSDSKKIQYSPYYLSLIYFDMGDYVKADEYAELFKERVEADGDEIPENQLAKLRTISKANVMMEHVQKIEIIDSLNVPKDDFFKYYKVSPEIGKFKSAEDAGVVSETAMNPVYMPESGTKMFWSQENEDSVLTLYQSTKLFDNSWDKPSIIDANLQMGADTAYPFMMADGTSMYFASKGEESLGGYDIFVASKDLETGKYYTPQNVGMPFNSPYDDYLYAVDELTGSGWWATDRNQIPDSVTIYIFIPSKMRVNYSSEDSNIISYAGVKSIADTWTEGADYSGLLETIRNIDVNKVIKKEEFSFVVSNDKIYKNYDDFNSIDAKQLMKELLRYQKELEEIMKDLKTYRAKFGVGNKALKPDIMKLETSLGELRRTVKALSNEVRKLEIKN